MRYSSKPLSERKKLLETLQPVKDKEKHSDDFKNIFSLNSVMNLGMGNYEIHRIPRKGHFFPRNNENRYESIPRNFFGTEFRWKTAGKRAEAVITRL